MRRWAIVTAAVIGCWLPSSAVHADDTVVVPGTSFPTGGTYLTYFGCDGLFSSGGAGPSTQVLRDDTAPLGGRALGLAVPGTGTATGPVGRVDSVAGATHQLTVRAPAGSAGVAYVWYVTAGLPAGQVWAGRAALTTASEGWQQVDAGAASYSWTRLDATSGRQLQTAPPADIDTFTAAHGDGPGYLLSGFGCDGAGFDLDAVRIGDAGAVTTYDLQGWAVTTTLTASATQVEAGSPVELSGLSLDPQQRHMGAALQLEARAAGTADFFAVGEPVVPDAAGRVHTTVIPEVSTDYRWAFPETGYADATWSPVVQVEVAK